MKKCQVLCHSCHKQKNKIDGSLLKNVRKGTDILNAKLTDDKVRDILKLKGILSQRKIAALYGVDHVTIGGIFRGQTWKHVKPKQEKSKK